MEGRVLPDRILTELREYAETMAAGASIRDQERTLPFEVYRQLRQLGIGRLRIPVAHGGFGGTVPDLINAVITIAEGDSSVAHALRSHFNFTESLVVSASDGRLRRWAPAIVDGALFGGASAELGTPRPGDVTATLRRQDDHYTLNGRKYYATGTAFADFAGFSALDDDGVLVSALIPTSRAGIEILDDWDGFGQRLTASGGVNLVDVKVYPEEISRRSEGAPVARHTSTLRQLHLAACCVGILRSVVSEAVAYVQNAARTTRHSAAEHAIDDPFVQQVVGELAAQRDAAEAMVLRSAHLAENAANAVLANDDRAHDLLIESALSTAGTQLVIGQLGFVATTNLFEVGGGSATSRSRNLDRHWRNLRTILSHNPLRHKARVIGDFLLSGRDTHLLEGRVF